MDDNDLNRAIVRSLEVPVSKLSSDATKTTSAHSSQSSPWSFWIAVFLSAVICWSATFHLTNSYRFLEVVQQYRLLTLWGGVFVGAALPFLMLAIAAALLIDELRWEGFAGSVLLFAIFGVAQVAVIVRGDVIDCGCFPVFSTQAGWRPLAIDAVLLLAALIGCFFVLADRSDSPVAIPMRTSRDRSASSNAPSHTGFTLVECLVVIVILGMLISLLLPAMQAVRERARGATCQSRLRQISLASHAFLTARKQFPPGVLGNARCLPYEDHYGNPDSPVHWTNYQYATSLVLCLSYLEEQPLLSQLHPIMLDLHRKLSDLRHASTGAALYSNFAHVPGFISVATQQISVFRCPSDMFDNSQVTLVTGVLQPVYDPEDHGPALSWRDMMLNQPADYGITNYAGCIGANSGGLHEDFDLNRFRGLMTSGERMVPRKCVDGLKNTIMFGEVIGSVSGGYRRTAMTWFSGAIARGSRRLPEQSSLPVLGSTEASSFLLFGSPHPRSVHFAFGDQRGQSVSRDIDADVLARLCGIADGA